MLYHLGTALTLSAHTEAQAFSHLRAPCHVRRPQLKVVSVGSSSQASPRVGVQFMNTGKTAGVTDLWARSPARIDVDCLYAGEVGCVAGAIKAVQVRAHLLFPACRVCSHP